MSGFCFGVAFTLVQATIPAPTMTLAWTHSVEKIRWEEDYAIRNNRLVLTAARVQGTGAGMEPGENAVRRGDWWEYHPEVAPLPSVTLAHSDFTDDYSVCANGKCQKLKELLGKSANPERPIDFFPCPAK
jgi:hypothetical protein